MRVRSCADGAPPRPKGQYNATRPRELSGADTHILNELRKVFRRREPHRFLGHGRPLAPQREPVRDPRVEGDVRWRVLACTRGGRHQGGTAGDQVGVQLEQPDLLLHRRQQRLDEAIGGVHLRTNRRRHRAAPLAQGGKRGRLFCGGCRRVPGQRGTLGEPLVPLRRPRGVPPTREHTERARASTAAMSHASSVPASGEPPLPAALGARRRTRSPSCGAARLYFVDGRCPVFLSAGPAARARPGSALALARPRPARASGPVRPVLVWRTRARENRHGPVSMPALTACASRTFTQYDWRSTTDWSVAMVRASSRSASASRSSCTTAS